MESSGAGRGGVEGLRSPGVCSALARTRGWQASGTKSEGSGSAVRAHLSAGRPGLHVPKLGHLEAVHGGWDRASAASTTRGVSSQVHGRKLPWTPVASSPTRP